MSKFAVFASGGKQYKVAVGDRLRLEKLDCQDGAEITFAEVLLLGGDTDKEVKVGKPLIKGAQVKAKVIKAEQKDKKLVIFKMKAKKRSKVKKGHRQRYTELEITSLA